MRMVLLIAVAWLAMIVAASAQSIDKPTAILEAASNTLAILEITSTEACIQQHRCHEANPIMPDGTTAGATAGRALIKGAGQAGTTWILLKLSKKHPKWARIGSIGKLAFNGWLAARALDYQR